MIGVFARPDHPKGYGGHDGTAHGYSVLLVRCGTDEQLAEVAEKLRTDGLPEPFRHAYPWYGGRLDLVAVVPHATEAHVAAWTPDRSDRAEKLSLGDNRFAGVYHATEVLQ